MMRKPRILIADNNNDYLGTVVEYLERRELYIEIGRTIDETRAILERGDIDIAVIDIRMEDDVDPNDDSGLRLAIDTAPQIPKIINTAYPALEVVREAMRRVGRRLPAAVDFIDKGDGVEALLIAIRKLIPLKDIFIIHGHDDPARLEVKDFLTQLHLNPIFLMDIPKSGQTILENLESVSCNYIIALWTPDDECKSDGKGMEFRARQNVVLETGYFMAKYGRDRMCILYNNNVVLPSDIHGLLWVKLDQDGAWKIALARELKAVGIPVDLNDILK